ncbi:Protein PHR1-LIKE 1 [Carex littledalei]|uniref:Protein PHR1-LIKE 1 n=1 Tax=Carex littledalei TaxID=544730 RepID=A0A833R5X6_9POAL|nr:Protein PHR1-LIKE 1 [Carex littledalei]
MMKQFESLWFFGIFSTCLPVHRCVEESSTTKEPELQENLIRGSQNVTLAPPLYPLMSITDDNTSMPPKEMQDFCNKTNVKNREDDWPDLEKILEETKPATSQVEQLAPESETPKKYIASQPHLYKIERTPPIAFQTVVSSSSGATSANLTCMRWTPELHDHFVEAFNQLGGSERSETKSGQIEETPSLRAAINDAGDIDINEALKIQMEVQKQLHEHLERRASWYSNLNEGAYGTNDHVQFLSRFLACNFLDVVFKCGCTITRKTAIRD